MSKIVAKRNLSTNVFRMDIEAPMIARERRAGQFVIVQLDKNFSERIPLTIGDANPALGTITIIFAAIGASTLKLSQRQIGDEIIVLGPLGRPTHIEKFGHAVCVGGGIGLAPLHPIATALKAAGNEVTIISGARNKDLLILQDEMNALADRCIVVTDDGSAGQKALVTEPLKEICASSNPPDIVVAIGPTIMMKFCAEATKTFDVRTLVSLNTIMIDGTGMCGCCRVVVGGKIKFVCVDGPEFDGHQVEWDSVIHRLRSYNNQESEASKRCHAQIELATKNSTATSASKDGTSQNQESAK